MSETKEIKFCEYCGNFLEEDGRCPDKECVWNVIIDALEEVDGEE